MPRCSSRCAPAQQARSLVNDVRIIDAALGITDRKGWRGLSVHQVAGMSRPAVLTRFKSRLGIVAAVWSQRLAGHAQPALAGPVEACAEGESGPTARAPGSSLEPFAQPWFRMLAAAELLIVGRCEPTVGPTLAATSRRTSSPGSTQAEASSATSGPPSADSPATSRSACALRATAIRSTM